ncbi:MAG: carboxypeptidase regulatory-like domain-containing protein [candidate division KSB1 bacterium]|nr:carboxypeptidase regulatory-like domain-containing protein [candidate division KSB1 bacterium]MDZ7367684.1 carboxypeptidase regulatory-like domain-containing protein [candidate division KSB1 bacterium]MDZ7404801.1 carboxypeptidase regulatory-like domain-containing protein [candidate division KSB1 bacterium]
MRLSRYLIAAVMLLGMVFPVAAQGPMLDGKLMITPHEARVEPGQGIKFQALLFNSQGLAIRIEKLGWDVSPESLGKISEDGFFMAGREDGEVKIIAKAQAGAATYVGEARVIIGKPQVLPVKIVVEPGEAIVPPLGTQQFKAFIITPTGRQPELAQRVKWDIIPNNLGKIEPNTGLFAAGPGTGIGTVVAFVEFGGAVHRGEGRVIVAHANASLAGNVKDQKSGAAIEKAVVWADLIGPFRFGRRVETDAQGNYKFEKLIPGLYVLRAEARGYLPEFYDNVDRFEQATPVRLAENENKTGINFTLSKGATISGSVAVDDDAKAPIAGAHVAAILLVRPDLKHHAVTDEKGNFALTGLPTGTYVVFAEAAGYKGEFFDNERELGKAKPISVRDEQTVEGINFLLATASAISGKVTEAAAPNNPIAKALVTIHVLINSSDKPRPVFNVLTNERGEYIANVGPGFYVVSAEARGFHKEFYKEQREFVKATPVQVFENKHTANIDFTMDKLATLSGRVTDEASGKPIAGAIVTAFQENTAVDALISKEELRLPFVTKTDENGNYKFDGVRAGKYFVQASARGYLPEFWKEAANLKDAKPVEVPESGDIKDINFTLMQGGAISGSVLSAADQKPLGGAAVHVFLKDSRVPMARGESGRDGKYRIEGLPSGEYIVFATAEGFQGLYYKDAPQREDATPVKVEAPKETGEINFQLKKFEPRGGTIAGVVVSEADKNPIPHAFVLVIAMSAPSAVPNAPHFAITDEFGKYKIPVPAGKYAALAAAPRFIAEYFDNAKTLREAKIFGVENGAVVEINFALTPAQRGPYQITGRVRHQNQGRGAENAVVQALDNGVVIAAVLTGNDGHFTLDEMPAGEFKISATSANGDAEQTVPVAVGNGRNAANVELILGTTSVQATTAEIPAKFELEQNYPNPFNPETSIKYHLPVRTNVTLRIYNALGQEIRTLVNTLQDAGVYSATWDGKDNNGRQLATGLYLLRLEAGDFVMTRKMAMVK